MGFLRRVAGRVILKPLKPTLMRELHEHIQTIFPEIGLDPSRYVVIPKSIKQWETSSDFDPDKVPIMIDAAREDWLTTLAQTFPSYDRVFIEFSPFVVLLSERQRNATLVHEAVHLSTTTMLHDSHALTVLHSICEGFGRYYEEKYLEEHRPSAFDRIYDSIANAVGKISELISRIKHFLSGHEYFDYYAYGAQFIRSFPEGIRIWVPTIAFIHTPTMEELREPGLYIQRQDVRSKIERFSTHD